MKKYSIRVEFDRAVTRGVQESKDAFEMSFDEHVAPGQGIVNVKQTPLKIEQTQVILNSWKGLLVEAELENLTLVKPNSVQSTVLEEGALRETRQEALPSLSLDTVTVGSTFTAPAAPGNILFEIAGGRGGHGTGFDLNDIAKGAPGARLVGVLNMPTTLEGQKFVILPGRRGESTISGSSGGDGCTGAGGGASYLMVTRTDLTGDNYPISQGYAKLGVALGEVPAGTWVQLLACAAGGQGGDDARYASHTPIPGSATFKEPVWNAAVSSTRHGAGFAGANASSTASKHAINGAWGAKTSYSRGGTSFPGFGGGGCNSDDDYGGFGGGINLTDGTAYSWVNPYYLDSMQAEESGGNTAGTQDGYIALQEPSKYTTTGTMRLRFDAVQQVPLAMKYDLRVPSGATSSVSINNALAESGKVFMPEMSNELLVEFVNPDGNAPCTFTLEEWALLSSDQPSMSVVLTYLDYYNQCIEPPVITYSGGTLASADGKPVAAFTMAMEDAEYDSYPHVGLTESFTLSIEKAATISPIRATSHREVQGTFTYPGFNGQNTTALEILGQIKP